MQASIGRILLPAALAVVTLTGLTQAQDVSWRVSAADAECFLSNIDQYRRVTDDPVVIFIAVCPETDRQKAIEKLQKNSGTGLRSSEDSQDGILVYTQAELDCLSKIYESVRGESSIVFLPKEPCGYKK